MTILRNEKGFAMGFVLILAVVALGLTLAMLYMVGTGSGVSGHQRRFHTALEAGRGGVEAMLQLIGSRGTPFTSDNNVLLLNAIGGVTNLRNKLDNTTDAWGVLDNSVTIDAADPATYDVRLTLGGYRAYGKIVDTVVGNSGPDEGLLKSGVVSTNSGEVMVMSLPYLYTVEVLAQSTANPTERSKISVLYQY